MDGLTPNRITRAISKTRAKLDTLDPAKVAEVDASLALDAGEHFAYQEQQARAHAAGILRTDEAQVAYIALGEVGSADNGGWADDTDTATKYAVTVLIGELLAGRLAAAA